MASSASSVKGYPTLNKDDLKLSEKGLSKAQREETWKKLHEYYEAYKSTKLGFPSNLDICCSGLLKDFLDFHVNNDGDPFIGDSYPINTKAMECAILDYFAKLWSIEPRESSHKVEREKTYWGYVVSMGCTKANLYGLFNARDYLSGQPLLVDDEKKTIVQHCKRTDNPNAFTPVAFFSEDAHFCQIKAMQVLQIRTFHELGSGHFPCPLTFPDDYPNTYSADFLDENGWPRRVPNGEDGSMYLPSLVKLVSAFVVRGYPPIVIFTIGCTFKGNHENPKAAIDQLVPILKQYNMYKRPVHNSENPAQLRYGFWFHIDGALGAGHLPFLEMAINKGLVENNFPTGFPMFDFRIPEVMSITVSFHKWFGCPFPSGIYMTRRGNQLKPPSSEHYVGSDDTTLSGSRNGHSIMVLWDYLSRNSYLDLTERAATDEKVLLFALKKFQQLQKQLGEDLWLTRSPGALQICFKQPRPEIVREYSLACKLLLVKNSQGMLERRHYAHICIMPHVDKELIEKFINRLKEPGAFPVQQKSNV